MPLSRVFVALLATVAASFTIAELAGCAAGGRGLLPASGTGAASYSSLGWAPTGASSPLALGAHPTAAQLGLWPRPGPAVPVCPRVRPGLARCFAWIRTDIRGLAKGGTPSGYAPADLQTAYGLTDYSADNGIGQTVAVVDQFDDPNAESDLAVYRAHWGLPPCTTANGCFQKKAYTTTTNVGWAVEETLDVDMVSAICPNCHILLVEAGGSTAMNGGGETYATSHATYVSNSWGQDDNGPGAYTQDANFNVPGDVITASTGDNAYVQKDGKAVAQWPAILPTVIAVGGTELDSANPRVEKAWNNAGSGCSKIYATPAFQRGIATGCSKRAQADVSMEADPNTGVAIYDTFGSYEGYNGWHVIGGTSASSPMIAAVYALGGCNVPCTNPTDNATYLYQHASNLHNITTGSNGKCGAPLCTAGPGWNGPTGLGTPNGMDAFAPPLVRLSPSSLTFGPYAQGPDTLTVSQDGFGGNFTQKNSCGNIASIKQKSNANGKASYAVAPIATGSCSATFTGDKSLSARIAISIPVAPVVLSSKSVSFAAIPGSKPATVRVGQDDFPGKFTETDSCAKVATVTEVTNAAGQASFSIAPVGGGTCSATFTGGNAQSAKLSISVTPLGPIELAYQNGTPFENPLYFRSATAGATNIDVTQSGYLGAFSVSPGDCVVKGLAMVKFVATSNDYGNAAYAITPVRVGACQATIGGYGQNVKMDVVVFGPIVVSPTSLSFTATGPSNAKTVSVSQAEVGDPGFPETDTCTGVATVVPGVYGATAETVTVTPVAAGSCSATFAGFRGGSVKLPISVVLAGPTPSPPPVFVADSGNGMVNEIPSGCILSSCVTTLGGGFSGPRGVALDGSGNIFVADYNGSAVDEIPSGCLAYDCVTKIGGGFSSPWGIAVDGSDNVFVSDQIGSLVEEIPSGCVQAACVTTLPGEYNTPSGLAVDSSGDLFIADQADSEVREIPQGCVNTSCIKTLGGGFSSPIAVALDASGNVYVADYGNAAAFEIPSGCATYHCVTTLGGGFNGPQGIAVDAHGYVYVGDYRNNAVKRVPPGCATAACVISLGGGFSYPAGIAVPKTQGPSLRRARVRASAPSRCRSTPCRP